MAYTEPKQWKKEESRRLRRGRVQIKFIDLRFERWLALRFRKARGRQEVPQISCPRDECYSPSLRKSIEIDWRICLLSFRFECKDSSEGPM